MGHTTLGDPVMSAQQQQQQQQQGPQGLDQFDEPTRRELQTFLAQEQTKAALMWCQLHHFCHLDDPSRDHASDSCPSFFSTPHNPSSSVFKHPLVSLGSARMQLV